jgi:hypothetical protein
MVALRGKKPKEMPIPSGKSVLQTLKLAEAHKRIVDGSESPRLVVVSRASRTIERLRLDVTNARHSAIVIKL